MKFLGPFKVVEGNSVKYSIVLDSMPTENVTVKTLVESTKNNSWFSVNVTPAVITFMPSTWNINEMINISVLQDNYISDPETLTVDKNCLSMDGYVGNSFEISRLDAVPSADVTISIADSNDKLSFQPNSFTVSKTKWVETARSLGTKHVFLIC